MKIPESTKKDRFYVATSLKSAYSSWDTLEKARESIRKYKALSIGTPSYKAGYDKIVCIVRTNLTGKEILK